MKEYLKKIKDYIGGRDGFFFGLYLFLIFAAQFINTYDIVTLRMHQDIILKTILTIIMYWVLVFLACFLAAPMFIKAYEKTLNSKFFISERETDKKTRILFFVIPFAVLFVNYIIYYPGSFNNDVILQLNESVSGAYTDWHPVIHTLLAIKLPLLISFNWIGFPVLVQIIFFALAAGYALNSIADYTNAKSATVTMLFFVVNPQTRNLMMSPAKDCAFAILTLLLVTFAMHIYFSEGEWFKSVPNTVLFIVVAALATLVRHNGVLFTAPYLLAIFVLVSKKRAIPIILCVLVLIAGIKLPLYSALNVQQPSNRQIETLGLPMTVIGAVAAYDDEALSDEDKEFVYKIADSEKWKKSYVFGSYNSIKYDGANNQIIEQYGYKYVIKLMLKCFIVSPFVSFKALNKLTEGAYSLNGKYVHFSDPANLSSVQVTIRGIPPLQKVNRVLSMLQTVTAPHLFMYTGAMHVIILGALVIRRKRIHSFIKELLLIIPVFSYNFGTMLLLTDTEDTLRFFYYTFLVTPALVIILLKDKTKIQKKIYPYSRRKM